jgi:hypothetical protein
LDPDQWEHFQQVDYLWAHQQEADYQREHFQQEHYLWAHQQKADCQRACSQVACSLFVDSLVGLGYQQGHYQQVRSRYLGYLDSGLVAVLGESREGLDFRFDLYLGPKAAQLELRRLFG